MLRNIKSNQGQTLIEFAFVIIPLLVLVLGIMEFGIVMYNKAVLTDACEAGARAGVMFRADATEFEYAPLTEAQIKTVIDNHVQNRLVTFGEPFDPSSDIDVSWDEYPPTHGGEIDVQVNFAYTFLALPNFGGMGSGPLTLSARSVMRME